MKIFKRIALVALATLVLYIFVTIGGAYKYLKEYGYGANYLPQTLAVHYGLNNGFTVSEKDGDVSVFIGRHDYIYEELFSKYGYSEIDRMGNLGYYGKDDDNGEENSFEIMSKHEWCHWFRLYSISNGYRIENFK
ncbi:MAG: hypothetical protein IJC69_02640 [Clostridia bacterium]|nr:hypothetical protein [Clostridia bacterium]